VLVAVVAPVEEGLLQLSALVAVAAAVGHIRKDCLKRPNLRLRYP
jgi:hypothetical protein